jgi:hypothetical protein
MADRVYRLVVTKYPEGWDQEDFEPEAWRDAMGLDVAQNWMDGDPPQFSWPTRTDYLSKTGAKGAADRLRSYGAEVAIVPSKSIEWPKETGNA